MGFSERQGGNEDHEGEEERTPAGKNPCDAAVLDFLSDRDLKNDHFAKHDREDDIDNDIEEDGKVDGGVVPVQSAFEPLVGWFIGFDAAVGEDGMFMNQEDISTLIDGVGEVLCGGDGWDRRGGVGIGSVWIWVVGIRGVGIWSAGRNGHEESLSNEGVFESHERIV